MVNFVAEHTLDLVAHGFPAGGAEMDFHPVGGLANFLYKCRVALLCGQRSRVTGFGVYWNGGGKFFAHRHAPFVTKVFAILGRCYRAAASLLADALYA